MTIDFRDSKVFWTDLDPSKKDIIIFWLNNYTQSLNAKPEAQISINRWGFLIRILLLARETSCNYHQRENRLEFYPEFNCRNIPALGSSLYTDFVFTCGRNGLTIFFSKLKAGNQNKIHPDNKNLAVQMAGVLFQLVDAILTSEDGEAIMFLPELRIFGALISGSKIEFAVARPIFDENTHKFKIIFETHSDVWSFNIFEHTNDTEPQLHSPQHFHEDVLMETLGEEEFNLHDEIDYIDLMEDELEEDYEEIEIETTDATPIINEEALGALAYFIEIIRSYYVTLPLLVSDMHLNPKAHE